MRIARQDTSITLSVAFACELKRIVRTYNAKDVRYFVVTPTSPCPITVLICVKMTYASLQLLVMLLLRQRNISETTTMHDGEHALSVLLSNKKVFGVLSTITNRKSI
jgi:hypothetical protein